MRSKGKAETYVVAECVRFVEHSEDDISKRNIYLLLSTALIQSETPAHSFLFEEIRIARTRSCFIHINELIFVSMHSNRAWNALEDHYL
jgi:hypothetical protein